VVDPAGCPLCGEQDAELSWASYTRLAIDVEVVDDSHFIVQLRRCPDCARRYVWIFTEFVDWVGGDDAQYRQIVPVTPAEAQVIAQAGEDVDLDWLGSLGRGRTYLTTAWPTGQPETANWSTGEFLVIPGH
jgi:hypothetical protein